MKRILIVLALFAIVGNARASHFAAAEIWYEHDTLNKYTIHLKLYLKCNVVVAMPTQPINVSGGASFAMQLTQDTTYNLYSCLPNSCQNPASALSGYKVMKFSKDTTLVPDSNWKFSWVNCCRNPNQTGPTASIGVWTTLDNSSVLFNNAPHIPYDSYSYYFVNQSNSINFGAIETDGDSIDYRLTAALNGSTPYPLTSYNPPHTPQSPLLNSALAFNNQTGLMTFTPTALGHYIIAIETREFRNGVQISGSIRDYQITIIGPSSNNFPNLSGINNTLLTTTNISACSSANMSFTINSSDPDASDSTEIIVLSKPSGSSFTTNNAQNQIGTFAWPVTTADVRAQPYLLVLEVRDNNCAVRHKVYQLYVNHCNTDSVWAGDADVNFTCDNYDVLNIGIANGATGPVRAGATITWQAEWCANWTNNFMSTMNYKHADCNGDGVVNATDLAAVTANYGLIHNKTNQIGQYKTLGFPDLRADVTNVNAHKGTTITIPVMLGDIASPMNDIYGIAATVEFLNAQTSAPISMSYNSSWIGNSVDSWLFERNIQSNKSAFTIVRNIQQGQSGYGQIATIDFPINAGSVTGLKVIVQFSDVKIIKKTGEEILDYNVFQDTITILAPTGLSEFDRQNTINIYPNPVKSITTISIKTDKAQDYKMVLYDVVGRLVQPNIYSGNLNAGEHTIELDLRDKAQGEYLLEIQTELGKKVIPIQKW